MDKIFENNSSDLPFQEDFPGKDDECDEIDWKEVEREAKILGDNNKQLNIVLGVLM